ncbi:MAG: AraC family transcriptional regulator [Lachnotalea sp.]
MKKTLQTKFSTRQYMLSKDFEIFYYNDNTSTLVKPHTHNYYEFYFFLEGDVEMRVGDKRYEIKYADLVLIPPHTSHYPSFLNQEKPYRRFVLWISQDYCNELMNVSKDYGYIMQYVLITKNYVFHNEPINFNAIQSMIFGLLEEIKSDKFAKEAEVSLRLNSLLIYLNRIVYDQNSNKTFKVEKALYLNLCDYINEHLEEELSLEKLAGEFYVSKFYISHVFKNNIGISIHQYIMKKRLQICKDAILGNETITNVYRQYGFNDYSSFYRAFKKEYGISPKEYKNMYQISEIL